MIDYPEIEIRDEQRFAAEAIARVSGGLTTDVVDAQIAARRELRQLVESGLDEPICPELTNANPGSPHTVLIETLAWALAQQAYRFNRVPEQNLIAFANLFGIERRPATAAVTVLRFDCSPPEDTDTVVAAGTEVSTPDGAFSFVTVEQLTIPYGDESGTVEAVRTLSGRTLLSPNTLTRLVGNPAFVTSVTNPNAVDSGSEIEPLPATLERVRRYQRRGERIVSTKDLEDAIMDDALLGNGVVRAFPFVKNGYFEPDINKLVGFTTVVVMTRTGDAIDVPTRRRIAALIDTAVGNQFIYVVDPTFIDFDVAATVQVNTGTPEGAVIAAIEANLRAFYSPSRRQFGRPILRSEIIAIIEGTTGVDRIVAGDPAIIASPIVDTRLREHELPRVVNVTINAV